jgi:small conductance mechanosensitive channel
MNTNELQDIDVNFLVEYSQKIYESALDYLPTIILAVLIFFVGRFIIKYIDKALTIFFAKANFDEALKKFSQSLIMITLQVILFALIISILGVETSSFVAVFGAMVFAVGMALQGSLSNFAGGVLILFFKPFKIDDFIVSGSHSGTVVDIQIFNTILKTLEGIKIILPNGPVSNNTIINETNIKKRRVEFLIGVSYSDNIKKVKEVLNKIAEEDDRILKEEDVLVAVKNLGDNAVEILFIF